MITQKGSLLIVIMILGLSGCKKNQTELSDLSQHDWIDLSYSYDSLTLYWPNNQTGFQHLTDAEGLTPAGYFYSSYTIKTPEHGGTHMDAPIHFAKDRLSVDEIPLKSLIGDAVVIDVTEKAFKSADYQVSVKDIENWEGNHGPLPEDVIVLVRTGYGKFYPDRERYFGSAKVGPEAIPELHFPGIEPEAAKFLVEKRKIKAIGLDTPSLDFGQSQDFKTHRVLMEANKPGFENLANLDQLPPKGIFVVALPMKIKKGSGGPLRIIATVK